jgi:hypothetical protein
VPAVVVDIDSREVPVVLAEALVRACSSALPEGECAYEEEDNGSPPPLVAVVAWKGAGERSVEIEVTATARGDSTRVSKSLRFRREDPRKERWRSVGLTIATLARELALPPGTPVGTPQAAATGTAPGAAAPTDGSAPEATSDSSDSSDDAEAPVAPAARAEPAPRSAPRTPASEDVRSDHSATASGPERGAPRARRSPWVDAGVVGGRAFAEGDARVGGFVALGLSPFGSPYFVRFGVSHELLAGGPEGVSAYFTTFSAGGGLSVRLPQVALALEPSVALTGEVLGAGITDPVDGREDSATQFGAGARAGAAVVWEAGRIQPLAGAEAAWHGLPTDILQGNRRIATVPAVGWSIHAGARLVL